MRIHRHKTAISRSQLSQPISRALADGLITDTSSVFDYGCGRGDDVRLLRERGIECCGWDPVHMPDTRRSEADVVNLGYVINVIEDATERATTLNSACVLARKLLIVSARLDHELQNVKARPHLDGHLTSRSTFQKFYTQDDLRQWIDGVLNVTSIAAGPGVFYVFRDAELQQTFSLSRQRRFIAAPRIRRCDELFEKHRPLFEALLGFMLQRGRLPADTELPESAALLSVVGSLTRAESILRRVTDPQQWDAVAKQRAEDLLVYLALSRFGGRPQFTDLPSETRLDVKAFFSTYADACREADKLLFSAGNMDEMDRACLKSPVGKKTPEALYIHVSALAYLPAILRVYEGCARYHLGVVDAANIIKLKRNIPRVSYLLYPEFDHDPHPALAYSLKFDLQTLKLEHRDYTQSVNPFILHRKETFTAEDYSGREKFARLTAQEEAAGLYESPEVIGTRAGWANILEQKRVYFRGHQLCRKRSL